MAAIASACLAGILESHLLPVGKATRPDRQPPMTTRSPTADDAAHALACAWQLLADSLQGAWAREIGGIMALVSRAPIAALNGVWIIDEAATGEEVEAGLDAVAATGLPHCAQLRPGTAASAREVPRRRGLVAEISVPLMATTGPLQAPA